ncbi:MAG: polysaccharide deacetylase [Clostridia bacterium]|nr:polysaccharide deacetylase [Clostridia bacterium]
MPDYERNIPKERIRKRKIRKLKQAAIYYGAALLVLVLVVWGLVSGIKGLVYVLTPKPKPVRPSVEQLIADGDMLAASYDFDKAIEHIKSYGEDYIEKPELTDAIGRYENAKATMVKFEDVHDVTHVFFHALIADSAKAFDGEYTQDGYNQYMVTVDEFKKMLEEFYNRDFVLVNLHDIAVQQIDENGNAKFVPGEIWLPEGKKPMVISQDDVCYYRYMQGDGFASKIVIGEDGYPTCEYIQDDGTASYGEYDLVPILENFIHEHPDFSYRGARATLAITGYDGVLGYRTCPSGEGYTEDDIPKAKAVADRMKELGWVFASHSWGHRRYGQISAEEVGEDAQKWENEVKPIIGETDILIYAHGDDIAGIEEYSGDTFNVLKSFGFNYFCNVDSHISWVQIGKDYVRQGRRNIDGYRMYYYPQMLEDLFDVSQVYDATRPVVPEI